MEKQFIGQNEIMGVEKQDYTTPLGGEVLKVLYTNGSSEITSKRAFDVEVSKEPMTAEHAQMQRLNSMILAVMEVIAEYDLKGGDAQPFVNKLSFMIQDAFDRASNYLWSKNDLEYAPGDSPLRYRSILEAHKIIKSIPDTENRQTKVANDTPKSTN